MKTYIFIINLFLKDIDTVTSIQKREMSFLNSFNLETSYPIHILSSIVSIYTTVGAGSSSDRHSILLVCSSLYLNGLHPWLIFILYLTRNIFKEA